MITPQYYHCLVGIPGSGKSTLAQYLLDVSPESLYICPDLIRQEIWGDAAVQGDWQEIQAAIAKMFEIATLANRSVVYDATNIKSQWRRDLLERYQPSSGQWIAWHVETPLSLCLQWNQERDRQVPDDIVYNYHDSLESAPPDVKEGFYAVFKVLGGGDKALLRAQVLQHLNSLQS